MKLLLRMGMLLGLAGGLISCQGSRQLVSSTTDTYTSIRVGGSALAASGDTADLYIQCIACDASQQELEQSINQSASMQQVPLSDLSTALSQLRYEAGTQVTLDLTIYAAGQPIYESCAGDAPGCASYRHRIRRTSLQELPVRLESVAAAEKAVTSEQEAIAGGPELEEEGVDVISSTDVLRPSLTTLATASFEPGHCFGELIDADGLSLGVYAGHFTGSVCLVPYEGRIEVINRKMQFVSQAALEQYELAFADPLDLVGVMDPEELRALPVGRLQRNGAETATYLCKDAASMRYGQTLVAEAGSSNFWQACQLTVNLQGEPLPFVEEVNNFLILSARRSPSELTP